MSYKSNWLLLSGLMLSIIAWTPMVVIATSGTETPSDIIVQVDSNSDINIVAADHQTAVLEEAPELGLFLLDGSISGLTEALEQDGRITGVYSNNLIEGQPRYIGMVGQELAAVPWTATGDPLTIFHDHWAAKKIRLDEAQALTNGPSVSVIVAVLDTGIDPQHTHFSSNLVAGYDFVDDDTNPTETRDGLDQDGDFVLDEGAGHGTHVAGIVSFVAPHAQIMPIRVFDDDGNGSYFDTIQGIIFAADNGADIINLSGSGAEDIPFLANAVDYAAAQDVIVVTAGGVNNLGYPASYQNVIAVGASDDTDNIADFADFTQQHATLYAPGLSIFSSYDDSGYATWSGNSMAAPFVAGTAALMKATGDCDAPCITAKLIQTAHAVVPDIHQAGQQINHGRLDVFDAVSSALDYEDINLRVETAHDELDSATDVQMIPIFNIINEGNSVNLQELTVRYWFNQDGVATQHVDCDFAAVSCDHVQTTIYQTAGSTQADSYIDIQFTANAGTLYGGHASGETEIRLHRDDWGIYDETNHYSYNGSQALIENSAVTLYYQGVIVWGSTPEGNDAPAPQPVLPEATATEPVQNGIRVLYRANDNLPYNGQIQPELQLVNGDSESVSLSSVRIRYWFTDGDTAVSAAHCDYAAVDCAHIALQTGNQGDQHYLDVTFSTAAGDLAANTDAGVMKLRLNHNDWSPYDETDDYSFDQNKITLSESENITIYIEDQRVWGIEP